MSARTSGVWIVVGALVCATACNNGSVTTVTTPPTAPSTTGPPSVTVTSVIPRTGAAALYTTAFSIAAGGACGQGLLLGAALTLDDGTVQDTADANGLSGFPPFAIDQGCNGTGISAAGVPQRLPSLPGVLHVTALTLYLSLPSSSTGAPTGSLYPTLAAAVATSRYTTDLYLLAQPTTSTGPAGSVSGNWSGSIQDDKEGAGSVKLLLVPSSLQIFGTWSFEFPRMAANMSGSVVGAVYGPSATLLLTPTGGACPLVLALNPTTAASGTTYAPASGCSLTSSGTANLTRQ